MKSILRLFLITLLWGLIACTEQSIDVSADNNIGGGGKNYTVPIDQALAELNSVLNEIDRTETRSGKIRAVKDAAVLRQSDVRTTRTSGASTADSLLYIVNFENNEGYAILSADSRVTPVIAIIDNGSMTLEEFKQSIEEVYSGGGDVVDKGHIWEKDEDDPFDSSYGVDAMIDDSNFINHKLLQFTDQAIRYDEGGGSGNGGGSERYYDLWIQTAYQFPMVTTKWGQRAPYNKLCPIKDGDHCVAGCVAVAVAQIVASNKIRHGVGPNWIHEYPLDWELIREAMESPTLGPNDTSAKAMAVAQLIRAAGRGVQMYNNNYGLDESSSNIKNAKKFFEAHGYYGVYNHTFRYKYARTMNLERNFPAYVRADSYDENGEKKGHAWLIDGWFERCRIIFSNIERTNIVGNELQTLHHCNFGWDGICDGYYSVGVFSLMDGAIIPDFSGEIYDKTRPYNYNLDSRIITYTEIR